MKEMNEEITKAFGNKLRVRACGLCLEGDKVLLAKHKMLQQGSILWAPPGGGIQFSESAEESLKREFKEETGLDIRVKEFLFINEFIQPPLHSIELFFEVEITGGKLQLGHDPELSNKNQLLEDIQFISIEETKVNPESYHSIFTMVNTIEELKNVRGYLKYENSMQKGRNFKN